MIRQIFSLVPVLFLSAGAWQDATAARRPAPRATNPTAKRVAEATVHVTNRSPGVVNVSLLIEGPCMLAGDSHCGTRYILGMLNGRTSEAFEAPREVLGLRGTRVVADPIDNREVVKKGPRVVEVEHTFTSPPVTLVAGEQVYLRVSREVAGSTLAIK